MVSHIERRKFLATLGGATAWPLAARAQQPKMLRVGDSRDRLWFDAAERELDVKGCFGIGEQRHVPFAVQVEALKRYRTGGKQKVTVEHVTVKEGGQAIVGNVTHRGRASPKNLEATS